MNNVLCRFVLMFTRGCFNTPNNFMNFRHFDDWFFLSFRPTSSIISQKISWIILNYAPQPIINLQVFFIDLGLRTLLLDNAHIVPEPTNLSAKGLRYMVVIQLNFLVLFLLLNIFSSSSLSCISKFMMKHQQKLGKKLDLPWFLVVIFGSKHLLFPRLNT